MFIGAVSLPDWAAAIDSWLGLVLAIVAALGIFRGFGSAVMASAGRRWVLARRLRSLLVGARYEYFAAVLGGAPAFGDDVRTWVFPEAFVAARVEGDVVTAYAITTRRRWFLPRLRPTGFAPIRLGQTTFADLNDGPREVSGGIGARRWSYAEVYYMGNPGLYREFAFAMNDAGYDRGGASIELARCVDAEALSGERPQEWAALRAGARFNTFAVSRPHGRIENVEAGPGVGVDLDEVRVTQDAESLWARAAWTARRVMTELPWRNG